MNKTDFESKVIAKLSNKDNLAFLLKYYRLNDSGDTYNLTNWIQEKGQTRQLNNDERKRIKNIFKSVGITPIKYIGLENYKQMFQKDTRFVPRFEQQFLFNEFADLPTTIKSKSFNQELLNHISQRREKSLVLSNYTYDKKSDSYILRKNINDTDSEKLRAILSQKMYKTVFIPGVLGFTMFFTLFNVIFGNLLALTFALILDAKIRTKNILRSIFFFPNILSLVIVAFIWSFIFRLIMPLVTGISVWLGSPDLAPYALLMVTIWQGCGWLMVIYLAGLQTIPDEVIEVAEIDGAHWWQRMYHIVFPLLLPAFTICIFFSLSNSLKTFDIIMALTQGGPGYVTTPIVLDIYYNAFRDNLYGYATAKAVFLCAIIMVVTGIQLSIMKRKEVEL
ncbi:MAG: carbohydrate ABC transporter permease [Bacillota bacterium]